MIGRPLICQMVELIGSNGHESSGERPGWADVPAVANNHLYEIKSPLILQPGPAALTDGLDALCEIIDRAY
jgi:iron complex transport system substrate-binding protein